MVIKFNHAAIKFTHLIKLWVKNSVATLLILTFSPSAAISACLVEKFHSGLSQQGVLFKGIFKKGQLSSFFPQPKFRISNRLFPSDSTPLKC